MISILNELDIDEKIPRYLISLIKSFYVFAIELGRNIIFITKDDKAYGFGPNRYGVLGLGHDRKIRDCTEVQSLSNLDICEFIRGYDFVLCVNKNGEVYGWGNNHKGQLGRKDKSKNYKFSKPQQITLPENDKIESISCGNYHTIVLLTSGKIYGWGDNSENQLGLNEKVTTDQPIQLNLCGNDEHRFIYIYCCYWSSFAINLNGQVFSWGSNPNGTLGQGVIEKICQPQIINLFNVCKICCNYSNSYFLTNEGSIYFCGKSEREQNFIQNIPKKIKGFECTSNDLSSELNICSDLENSYYEFSYGSIKKSEGQYGSIEEFCAKNMKLTPRMIRISNELDNDTLSDMREIKILDIPNKYLSTIGKGGFGKVEKFWCLLKKRITAIKSIFNTSHDKSLELREVEAMSKIKSSFVVKYITSWNSNERLFIQMEYCFHNLRQILIFKPNAFKRNKNEAMNSVEYFISCEIFRQITEALNYLHSLKPNPLVHRDLKPENILIGMAGNKRICKLADFGLSKFIENHSDYHTNVGATRKYRAPEIGPKIKYGTKVDVYSLGMIGLEIFNLEEKTVQSRCSYYVNLSTESVDRSLKKFEKLISSKVAVSVKHSRISCKELLNKIKTLSINKKSITQDQLIMYRNRFENFNMQFFVDILSK